MSNETNEISIGSPTLDEIREYFLNEGWNSNSPANYSSTSSDSSFDLNESFKKLLETRQKKFEARKTLIKKAISNNFHSPVSTVDSETMNPPRPSLYQKRINSSMWQCQDTTTFEEEEDWRKVSEDSFAATEQLCCSPVKTQSRREAFSLDSLESKRSENLINLSTDTEELDSDEQEAAALVYSPGTSDKTSLLYDTVCSENTAMSRLLKDLDAAEIADEIRSKSKEQLPEISSLADMTQLNDIEAPSMWENTTFANSPRPSPMKMVGMLRPSTILEESTLFNDLTGDKSGEEESIESFITAFVDAKEKTVTSNQSTEDFCTAEERSTTSEKPTSTSDSSAFYPGNNTEDGEIVEVINISSSDDDLTESSLKKEDASSVLPDETRHTDLEISSMASNSEYSVEDNSSGGNESPRLNDTLEMVEIMMEQGKRLMEQAAAAKIQESVAAVSVLTPQSKVQGTRTYYESPDTPETVIKKRNINSPKTMPKKPPSAQKIDSFKRPPISSRIPQASRVTPHNQNKFSRFNHIMSPIGMYIKNTPQVMLDSKHKGGASLLAKMHNKSVRESEMSFKENVPEDMTNYKPTIPRKGVVAASARQLYDERIQTKICGGKKINQLLGSAARSPTIITHEGRLKMDDYARYHVDVNDTIDDSLADLSVMSGDVSVQVVRNANRF